MNRGHGYARGASAFLRPENALKRAEELLKVGQKTAAVLALHDVLTSRRHRAWNKGLEEIVFRFIDLCVEERMGRYAKEALMQYRNTCQNVNINSLEEVIKYLLKKATERAEEAQAKADVRTICLSRRAVRCRGTPLAVPNIRRSVFVLPRYPSMPERTGMRTQHASARAALCSASA